jgi:hypothetical protein
VAHGLLINEFSLSHKTTRHSRLDPSGQVISSSQRPLLENTNTHDRQTSIPSVGFEPTISAGERSQNYALDRAVTGIGSNILRHANCAIVVQNALITVKNELGSMYKDWVVAQFKIPFLQTR